MLWGYEDSEGCGGRGSCEGCKGFVDAWKILRGVETAKLLKKAA